MEIKTIVFTGPPGSGKSESLEVIPGRLAEETDWYPMTVPEAATIVSRGGVGDLRDLKASNFKKYLAIQEEIFDLDQYLTEQRIREAEILGVQKLALLKDRGRPDIMAYLGDPKTDLGGRINFMRMIRKRGFDLARVRECYQGVIFLCTPPPKRYTRANNKARTETMAQATALELPTKHAWLGHPHQWIVPSMARFEDKIERAYRALLNILGNQEIERRFRLLRPPDWNIPELRHAQFAGIRQRYLKDDGVKSGRIRKRVIEEDGSVTYHFTQKSAISAVRRSEEESDILYDQYRELKSLKDPGTRVLKKRRAYINGGSHIFEVDTYRDMPELVLIECELLHEDDSFEIPPCLGEYVEVTDDPRYRNSAIAKLSWKIPD